LTGAARFEPDDFCPYGKAFLTTFGWARLMLGCLQPDKSSSAHFLLDLLALVAI
jgi:hypothetical protein